MSLSLGLAGLAPAAFIAGAVSLGLAGIALEFRRRNRYYYNPYYRNFRAKRSAAKKIKKVKNENRDLEEEQRLEQLMQVIREEDVTKCGMKLVCELAAYPYKDLTDEAAGILDIVG